MAEVYMGYLPIAKAKSSGRLVVTGDRTLGGGMAKWFGFSTLANVERMVA
jgi:hypothetical protein